MQRQLLLTKNNRICPERKEKIDKEKKEAEEIRNKALERVGETRKRQQLNEGSTEDVKPGKRKRSGS